MDFKKITMNKHELTYQDAVNCIKIFIEEYEDWEATEGRRKTSKYLPNHEKLATKYYEAYKLAKRFDI